MSHNVVATWRGRGALLGREGWQCAACKHIALARRRICVACGAEARALPAPLPRRGIVTALSVAGAAVEHLDQVTGKKPAVLVELEGGTRIACLLAHADSISLAAAVRGQPVRLAVRRIPLAIDDSEPIPYGLKAALDLETRAALKANAGGEGKKE
jgi:uncharacterized OB-fold protein